MDKEVKKAIKKILWLDFLFESSDSIWTILDEIEDELEEMFGHSKSNEKSLEELFKIKKDN